MCSSLCGVFNCIHRQRYRFDHTSLCKALAYAVVVLSVCLSVCLLHAGIVSKRIVDSSFLTPWNDLDKKPNGDISDEGAKYTWRKKTRDFPAVTGHLRNNTR